MGEYEDEVRKQAAKDKMKRRVEKEIKREEKEHERAEIAAGRGTQVGDDCCIQELKLVLR